MDKKVGILAIQGSFAEHGTMLKSMGVDFVWVKDKETLASITHLIIPGGESTTMRKLLGAYGMWKVLKDRIMGYGAGDKGPGENPIPPNTHPIPLAVFGTCAGAIILADFMDIEVERNAYGGQQESFITDLEFKRGSFKGVFIRAPKIMKVGPGVEVLAWLQSTGVNPGAEEKDNSIKSAAQPVLVRQNNLLVATFHPELSGAKKVYEYFLEM